MVLSSLLAALIIGAVGAGAAVAGSAINSASQKKANDANVQMQKEANEANIQMQRETNEANSAATAATNQANIDLQREVMGFNSAEAQKQRDWEEYMSNTATQRKMADLQAAGVNPLLALDSPAAAMSGPAASASATRLQPSHSEASRVDAARIQSLEAGSALQSLASLAQSAAFMAALNYGRKDVANTYARSRAEVASINSAARTKDWQQYSYKLSDGSWLTQRKY